MDGFRRVKLKLPDRVAAAVELAVLVEILAVGERALAMVRGVPVVPQLRPHDEVTVGLPVEAPRHLPEVALVAGVERSAEDRVADRAEDAVAVVVAEPLQSHAADERVAEVVEHVLVDAVPSCRAGLLAEGLLDADGVELPAVVVLEDVRHLVVDLVDVHRAEDRPVADRRQRGGEATDLIAARRRHRQRLRLVVALDRRTAEERGVAVGPRIPRVGDPEDVHRVAVVVPAVGDPGEHRGVVGGLPGVEDAGVSKRLAVLHRIGVRVEEVTDGRHDLVADDRVEVSELHRVVAVADLAVQLRHGQAVVLARVPAAESGRRLVVEVAVEAACGREDRVSAIEQIDPTTPVGPPVLEIEHLLIDEIELVDLGHPVAVVERDRAVERRAPVVAADAGVDPAVGGDTALLEKLGLKVAGRALLDLLGRLLWRQAAELVGVFLRHVGRDGGKAAAGLAEGRGGKQRGGGGQARSEEGQLCPIELHVRSTPSGDHAARRVHTADHQSIRNHPCDRPAKYQTQIRQFRHRDIVRSLPGKPGGPCGPARFL